MSSVAAPMADVLDAHVGKDGNMCRFTPAALALAALDLASHRPNEVWRRTNAMAIYLF
jgi:hypothetical protein